MSDVSSPLAHLLSLNNDIAYLTMESIAVSKRYEAKHNALTEMQKYEQKWQDAYDDAYSATKDIKMCGAVFIHEGDRHNAEKAKVYADWKVEKFDEEVLYELAEEDFDLDTQNTTLETLLESKRAQKDTTKQLVNTNAQDSGVIQS